MSSMDAAHDSVLVCGVRGDSTQVLAGVMGHCDDVGTHSHIETSVESSPRVSLLWRRSQVMASRKSSKVSEATSKRSTWRRAKGGLGAEGSSPGGLLATSSSSLPSRLPVVELEPCA